jgi:hypothetical protein
MEKVALFPIYCLQALVYACDSFGECLNVILGGERVYCHNLLHARVASLLPQFMFSVRFTIGICMQMPLQILTHQSNKKAVYSQQETRTCWSATLASVTKKYDNVIIALILVFPLSTFCLKQSCHGPERWERRRKDASSCERGLSVCTI